MTVFTSSQAVKANEKINRVLFYVIVTPASNAAEVTAFTSSQAVKADFRSFSVCELGAASRCLRFKLE